MSERVRIGDLLVAAKLVTTEQVSEALVSQRESGRRLGEELVAKGFVTEFQLTQILSNQLAIPWVSLQRIEFTRDLLNMVPAEVANRLCVIPIYMRRVRAAETLYVAMDDPTNEPAIDELITVTGLPVKAMVSSPSEIRHAIRVYYLGGAPQVHPDRRASRHPDADDATEAALQPVVIPAAPPTGLGEHSVPANAQEWESGVSEAPNPAPAAAPPAASLTPPSVAPAPPAPEAARHEEEPPPRRSYSDITDEVPVDESAGAPVASAPAAAPMASAPAAPPSGSTGADARSRLKALRSLALTPAAGGDAAAPAEPAAPTGVKMVTLTLLDGSTVRLPAPGGKRRDAQPQAEGGLTASDLVSALLARAQGADVSDVLPDQQWEVLFASLLTLLIRKGLLADWEFVEEWKKRQGS